MSVTGRERVIPMSHPLVRDKSKSRLFDSSHFLEFEPGNREFWKWQFWAADDVFGLANLGATHFYKKMDFGSEPKKLRFCPSRPRRWFWGRMRLFFEADVILGWPRTSGVHMVRNWNFDPETKNCDFALQTFGLVFEGLKSEFRESDTILCWPHTYGTHMCKNWNFDSGSKNYEIAPRPFLDNSEFWI